MNRKFRDFSTLASYRNCKEQARLAYVLGYQPIDERPALSFGSAFHAGIAGFYIAMSKGISRDNCVEIARAKFVKEIKKMNSALPISIESDEKRSVERGVALLEAYFEHWKNEPYKVHIRPDNNDPYVEISFRLYVTNIDGVDIIYYGKVDRVMKNLIDGHLYNFETKTTSQGLPSFIKQVRPNHQVTGYHVALKNLGLDVVGTQWDCIFVSDRKPAFLSPEKAKEDPVYAHFLTYGVDIKKDFYRQDTRRSATDMEEWWYDLEYTINDMEKMEKSGLRRWERNAPHMCHSYGGCQFREVCGNNLNEAYIRNKFVVKPWEPWKEDEEDGK